MRTSPPSQRIGPAPEDREKARAGVLDVGVGMRPDLTRRGLGREFATVVLDHGRVIPGTQRLRAVVQDWNERSRRLLVSLGFAETGEHQVGEVRYVVYEQEARTGRSADGEQTYP